MRKLVAILTTKGKTPEQVGEEMMQALVKFQKVSSQVTKAQEKQKNPSDK